MVDLADVSPPFASVFDPDLRVFMELGPMAARIVATGDAPLDGRFGPTARSLLESLAMNHRRLLETVEQVTARSLNRLLCQMTADATGLPVIARPAEATAIGNVAMQAIATGQNSDLEAARIQIDRSFPTERYEPNPDRLQWDVAYARWQAIASR
jgi:rhamnulokinase